MYPRKASISLPIFALFLAALTTSLQFVHERYGFEITVPPGFEVLRDPHPGVGALLRFKGVSFPTFNVTVVPGIYDATADEERQVTRLVDDYARVGISSVTVIHAVRSDKTLPARFAAELTYTMSGTTLHSKVEIVPMLDRHFILTFIDEEGHFDPSLANQLVQGFKAHGPSPQQTESAPAYYPYLAVSFLVIVLVLVLIRTRGCTGPADREHK